MRRTSGRSEVSSFDVAKQNVEARIQLFNRQPLIDSIDNSMVSVSNPEVSKLEINKEEAEASLSEEDAVAFGYHPHIGLRDKNLL